jgi:flagellin
LQLSGGDKDGSNLLNFQMGEFSDNVISLPAGINASTVGLELDDLLSVVDLDVQTARKNMQKIDKAIDKLNSWRSEIGSTQNQVESSIRNLMTQHTNIKAAESVVRDVDYAQESANFSRLNIISQAGTYAISQANEMQKNILRLLQ